MPAFCITRRVEFGDTDMAGIMHYSNFFRFMEVAETSFLQSLGASVHWRSDDGTHYGFPRVKVGCEFVKPVRFEDILTIRVAVERLGTKSISYRFEFANKDEVIAIAAMTSVYCRNGALGTMESVAIPEALRAKLQEHLIV